MSDHFKGCNDEYTCITFYGEIVNVLIYPMYKCPFFRIKCPDGYTGRLVGGSQCTANNQCDVYPNHICYVGKFNIVNISTSGVCCQFTNTRYVKVIKHLTVLKLPSVKRKQNLTPSVT